MYYVYVLKSLSRNYIYVGLSGDVDARISQHNRGYEKTTKPYRPFVVVKVEAFETRVTFRIRSMVNYSAHINPLTAGLCSSINSTTVFTISGERRL
jgi:putative endonuclease